MIFTALGPAVLVAAALAVAAAIITLHLLRRTPRAQRVSNLEFWRRAVERSAPRSLFSRRVPWVALLVSLAIGLLFVGELGEPRYGAGYAGTTVFVLAADRTMGARDARGRSRFDEAVALARTMVQADTVSGQVALVRAGVHTSVVLPLTHRAVDAERALDRLEVDEGTAELATAVTIARGIVRGVGPRGRVVVIADREDFARPEDPAIPVVLVPLGVPGETIAVTALDARRDPNALGEYDLRCEVRSFTARHARARLVVRDRDAVLFDQRLDLEPGVAVTQRAHGFSSAQGELVARLQDIEIEGGRDALASDDVAYATVPPAVATRVLLVTPGNRYLANALAANPTVQLETIAPAALAARRSDLGRFHAVVLDRVRPEPPVEHPALLVLGASDSRVVRLGEELTQPRVTTYASEHRVLAGLRFDQVQIARAHGLIPSPDDRVLVRSGRSPLAVARDRDGARLIALGFDTEGTDLAQRILFPLFVHNSLLWLVRRDQEFRSWQPPGQPVRAAGTPGLVLTPDGEGHEVQGALYDTGRAGIYHSADRATAVSAADEAGSLASLDEQQGASGRGARATQRGKPSLVFVLGAVLLGLLCVEWVLLHRGRLR